MRSVSINILREMLYDINNGLFSTTYEANNKYYRDTENELDIEMQSEYNHLTGAWQLDVIISDAWGDEDILEERQWAKLHKALMGDVEWREQEARSEAEYIKHLWRTAYA